MPALRARSVTIKISHRTRRREIAGQRRPHRHHEPDAIPIGKPEHERLECQDCRNVADDVREYGSVGGENMLKWKLCTQPITSQVAIESEMHFIADIVYTAAHISRLPPLRLT